MLLKLEKEQVETVIKDDPVRPHFSAEWRTQDGREVYGLFYGKKMRAIICVAYTTEVPNSEQRLEYLSQAACQDGQHGNIAVFYTVWSYDKGAGREVLFSTVDSIKKEKPRVTRFVTLSPLTKMAERFHLRNGAKLLDKHKDCQNFEYEVDKP